MRAHTCHVAPPTFDSERTSLSGWLAEVALRCLLAGESRSRGETLRIIPWAKDSTLVH